jgi:hypothetical protein
MWKIFFLGETGGILRLGGFDWYGWSFRFAWLCERIWLAATSGVFVLIESGFGEYILYAPFVF